MFSDELRAVIERAQHEQLEAAKAAGCGSIDEFVAMQTAGEVARRAREDAVDLRRHRASVIDAFVGRFPDVTVEALRRDEFERTKAIETINEWLATAVPAIVLSGGVGIGKTVAAVYALTRHRVSWQVVRAQRIGAHYERWQSDREDNVVPLRVDVSLLLVDDLGKEGSDRRAHDALDEVADARQSRSTRTIYTTNLSGKEFAAREYSHRFRSRLAQSAIWESVVGPDLRRPNSERAR